jgi:hypothetical protein
LPWLLAAVETVRPPSKGPTVTAEAAADVVFDDHSHEVLGSYRSPLTAQRAGEKYAAAWLKRRPRKRCKCGPIAK